MAIYWRAHGEQAAVKTKRGVERQNGIWHGKWKFEMKTEWKNRHGTYIYIAATRGSLGTQSGLPRLLTRCVVRVSEGRPGGRTYAGLRH